MKQEQYCQISLTLQFWMLLWLGRAKGQGNVGEEDEATALQHN